MASEDKFVVEEIRKLVEDRVRSVRAKDVEAATSHAAPDVMAFDVVDPLRYAGSDALKKRTEEWFSSFDGPISFEVRDLSIASGGDVAFSHSLNRVTGTKTDGKRIEMWWRATVCYRRMEGRWLITHEHNSVPFDPQTGRASLELRP
jgi:uncharacterized protein (TIGR02246 family)